MRFGLVDAADDCLNTVERGFNALGARLEPVESYTDENCMRCGSCLQGCPTNAGEMFGMDVMMNICLIYLMIGPSGAALSLDRWLAKGRAQRELARLRKTGGDTSAVEAFLAGL